MEGSVEGAASPRSLELLVVSRGAPPTIGETPTVLRNLLQTLSDVYSMKIEIVRQLVRPEEPERTKWPTTTLRRPRPLKNVRGGHYSLAPGVFAVVLLRVLRRRRLRILLTF